MSDVRFIIVERGIDLRDSGVFTGRIHLGESEKKRGALIDGWVYAPAAMHAIASVDLEDAFLFQTSAQAWSYANRFHGHYDAARNCFLGADRWVVRQDGDYRPGEFFDGPLVPRLRSHLFDRSDNLDAMKVRIDG